MISQDRQVAAAELKEGATATRFAISSKHGNGLHIPVENEHLFRFKMNADSGLRVHHFRTPQSTNSDVR
jgi:hypothetical protein